MGAGIGLGGIMIGVASATTEGQRRQLNGADRAVGLDRRQRRARSPPALPEQPIDINKGDYDA
jgi:hypothetical protein